MGISAGPTASFHAMKSVSFALLCIALFGLMAPAMAGVRKPSGEQVNRHTSVQDMIQMLPNMKYLGFNTAEQMADCVKAQEMGGKAPAGVKCPHLGMSQDNIGQVKKFMLQKLSSVMNQQ